MTQILFPVEQLCELQFAISHFYVFTFIIIINLNYLLQNVGKRPVLLNFSMYL